MITDAVASGLDRGAHPEIFRREFVAGVWADYEVGEIEAIPRRTGSPRRVPVTQRVLVAVGHAYVTGIVAPGTPRSPVATAV